MVWGLYEAFNTGGAELLLLRMVQEDYRRADLYNLEPLIADPLLEVLDKLKENPVLGWPREAYEIIGTKFMLVMPSRCL